MSYSLSAALQTAVFQQISGDAAVVDLVGADIYDAPPNGTPPSTYVTLGPETVLDRSDKTGNGARHDFTVSVVSDAAGFQTAKQVAAAVNDALDQPLPALSRGQLISLTFLKARAKLADGGALRRIDLSFRALVEDT